MINIHPKGRLGNLMFQYALSRIIAEDKDYATDMELPFENAKILSGKHVSKPVEKLTGHDVGLKGLLRDKSHRRIFLQGFFQRVEYYEPYQDKIKEWFKIKENYRKPGDKDLVVHVRGGDLYNKGGNAQHTPLPYNHYKQIIETVSYENLFIVTERPNDLVVQKIHKEHKSEIISQNVLQDYYFMLHAKHLVLSVCTIAWWAGWLGEATVHFPLTGFWHPHSVRDEINLRVYSNRYIYYDLGVQDNWTASDEQIENLLK